MNILSTALLESGDLGFLSTTKKASSILHLFLMYKLVDTMLVMPLASYSATDLFKTSNIIKRLQSKPTFQKLDSY